MFDALLGLKEPRHGMGGQSLGEVARSWAILSISDTDDTTGPHLTF